MSLPATLIVGMSLSLLAAACGPTPGPRTQLGTEMGIYAPGQPGDAYDGLFRIRGEQIYQIGSLSDTPPWDHVDGPVRSVIGSVTIDVNELTNTGTFRAELTLSGVPYVIEIDRFKEYSTCQDGGIAAYIIAHGDSGCGDDAVWRKTLIYVGGWGEGRVTLNGEPFPAGPSVEYEIGFMVSQGIRRRDNLSRHNALEGARAGAVNPAVQQIAFYAKHPKRVAQNNPAYARFDHFLATRVIWE